MKPQPLLGVSENYLSHLLVIRPLGMYVFIYAAYYAETCLRLQSIEYIQDKVVLSNPVQNSSW
jgi:hypothetical protein